MSEIEFASLTRADFPVVARWLADPDVHRWWNHEFDAAAVERDFGPTVDGREPNEDLIASLGGTPIGLVQRSRVNAYADNQRDFGVVVGEVADTVYTLDYLVGDRADRGRGVGTAMIAAATADTYRTYDDATSILISIVAANRPSWRACERAGYLIVGSAELEPDNPVDDWLHYILRHDRDGADA